MKLSPTSKERLETFFKTGLFIMSASLLLTIGLKQLPFHLPAESLGTLSWPQDTPVSHIETDSSLVALTFDVAMNEEGVTDVLSLLEKEQVHATFFLSANWAEKHPETAKAIASEGHDIGTFGVSHRLLTSLTKEECGEELSASTAALTEITGIDSFWFRPPYGEYNRTVLDAAKTCACPCILWDVDSLDWKDYSPQTIADTVLTHQELSPGSIVLFRCGTKNLPEALPLVLRGLEEQGYRPASLSELLSSKAAS